MARCVEFPEQNAVLVGSPEDRAANLVDDLHIHRHRDLDGNHHVISKWRLTPEELEEVRRTGAVWVHAWGSTHPPIAIGGSDPFKPRK